MQSYFRNTIITENRCVTDVFNFSLETNTTIINTKVTYDLIDKISIFYESITAAHNDTESIKSPELFVKVIIDKGCSRITNFFIE